MAFKKHNTYYDYNELYYFDENGVKKPLQLGIVYSAGNGIKIENDIISVSGKYVASANSALDNKQLVLKDNKWVELVLPPSSDWLPTIKEASANSYNAATAWTNAQNYLTAHQIIPSAKWENASDVVETNSAKWNVGYNTLTANSADWMNVSAIPNLTTKVELNTASSTLNENKLDKIVFDEYKNLVNVELAKKQDKSSMSAYALSSWVDENYQKKGDYLSANALDLIKASSSTWNEVSSKLDKNAFNTWSADYDLYLKSIENDVDNLKTNSSNWDSVYNNVNTNSAKWDAASDEVISHSANYNSVYETVQTNSGDWEEITKVKTFKTIGGIEAETSADSLEFSAGENIKIGINEGKIYVSSHDTTYDENDFISASHLNNIISVSATVKSNSADWTSAAKTLEASANIWNELYDEYQDSSISWNDTTDVVNTFSGNWNEISTKADKIDLDDLSGKVETLSGELKTTSANLNEKIEALSDELESTSSFLSGAIDVVSTEFENVVYKSATADWDVIHYSAGQNINITNHTISGKDWTDTIEEASANAVTTVENNFNCENGKITSYGTSSFANDQYTAGEGLALNDHQFYVSGKYITSASDSLSGKMLVLKDNEWLEMPEFGGFATANSGEGHPDVQNPSTKLIYLVKNSNVTGNDKYSEWIYTSAEQTTAWECIGDTSLDLTPYLTKVEAEEIYQPKGNYVSSTDISDMATQTWVGQQGFYTKASGDNDYAPISITADVNTLTNASAGWNDVTAKLDASVASTTYQTKEAMNDYLTKSEASSTYQEKGNYLVANDITGKLDKSIYENASGNWENTYNTVNQYSGTWLTAHQSLDDYATKASLESTSAEITAMIPTDLFTQASADTLYQPIGDYYSATNPSGFIDGLVVLDYGVSTWQDFYDAYKKNKVILCRVQSGETGYRHGFVAWIDGTPNNPTQVQFQYYRNVNPHKSNQQVDEIYIYTLKPNTEPAWTTSKRNTGTQIVAGAGLSSKFEASPSEITLSVTGDYVTSSNLVANNQYTLTTTGWSAVTIPDTLSAGSGVEIVSNGINALLGTDLAFNATTSAIQINTDGTAIGTYAFVEGTNTTASGNGAHAEGVDAGAIGQGAHAGGYGTHTTGVGNFIHGTFLNFASPDGTTNSNTPVFVGGTLNATTAQNYNDHGGYLQIMGNGTYVGAGQGNNSDAYILYRDGTVSAKQFQNADGTETINGTTYSFTGVDNIEILPSGAIADTANFPNDNVLRFILES